MVAGRGENLLTGLDRTVLERRSRLLRRAKRFLEVSSTCRLRSEWGDYEGAKDAMVAKSMCQARVCTVIVETADEATLLQREAAPLSRNYCVVTCVGHWNRGCDITAKSALGTY